MPKNSHIMVIDPGTRHPELDTFNQLLLRGTAKFSYHLPALHGMASMDMMGRKFDGCIILGSGASVHDSDSWQSNLRNWLTSYVFNENKPVIGICYGHQLIAHMYGAEIQYMDKQQTKLQELRKIEVTDCRFINDKQYKIYVSHRELVSSIPADFTVIARSDQVAIEGLQHRDKNIWTIAGHPEATYGFLQNQDMLNKTPNNDFNDGHEFIDSYCRWVENNT